MLTRPCGKVVMVYEDVMSHTQLGDGNLLIVTGTTTRYLSSARKFSIVWMELSTETGSFMYTIERAFPITWVSTM